MHLLHAKYLTFYEYFDEFPPYAIFSHTWGDEEVTMEDMLQGRARSKKGFKKIDYCATQALRNGYDFIWVDTCCILKTSSSELSEAINSMFQWYKNSKVCYAYLADVEEKDIPLLRTKDSKFRKSRWFTRGWTLQELLAPSDVWFYSADWKYIGSKEEESMGDLLEEITGINMKYLDGFDLQHASISERMFWASKRKTTRREDIAYCLLGIFNVNMPLLYGEGEKAFFRLQKEIMKNSDDLSLFAWVEVGIRGGRSWTRTELQQWTRSPDSEEATESGLLASSPACFTMKFEDAIPRDEETPYFMTNKGLSISLWLANCDPQNDVYIAQLVEGEHHHDCGVFLRCISDRQKRYVRIWPEDIVLGFYHPLHFREKLYIAPGSYSTLVNIVVHLDWQTEIPQLFSEAAALICTEAYFTDSGRGNQPYSDEEPAIFPNCGEIRAVSLSVEKRPIRINCGETCVISYLIKGFNVRFFVLLYCTKAARCLFRVEQDNGSTPEQLLKEWNRSRWKPVPTTMFLGAEYLKHDQGKFEIEASATHKSNGGVDFKLKLTFEFRRPFGEG